MKPAPVVVVLVSLVSILAWRPSLSGPAAPSVPYPDGYRDWAHVKSAAVGPTNKRFASVGGFQHIHANREAMVGYRTRAFPEGSALVFDWLEMRELEGAFSEGARRQVDVMM